MKEPLVCTLHLPIQASVDRCGNITSQRVAITGEITNFECHQENFMDYLENPRLYCDVLSYDIRGSVDL